MHRSQICYVSAICHQLPWVFPVCGHARAAPASMGCLDCRYAYWFQKPRPRYLEFAVSSFPRSRQLAAARTWLSALPLFTADSMLTRTYKFFFSETCCFCSRVAWCCMQDSPESLRLSLPVKLAEHRGKIETTEAFYSDPANQAVDEDTAAITGQMFNRLLSRTGRSYRGPRLQDTAALEISGPRTKSSGESGQHLSKVFTF